MLPVQSVALAGFVHAQHAERVVDAGPAEYLFHIAISGDAHGKERRIAVEHPGDERREKAVVFLQKPANGLPNALVVQRLLNRAAERVDLVFPEIKLMGEFDFADGIGHAHLDGV